jgi:hypothetical protein
VDKCEAGSSIKGSAQATSAGVASAADAPTIEGMTPEEAGEISMAIAISQVEAEQAPPPTESRKASSGVPGQGEAKR